MLGDNWQGKWKCIRVCFESIVIDCSLYVFRPVSAPCPPHQTCNFTILKQNQQNTTILCIRKTHQKAKSNKVDIVIVFRYACPVSWFLLYVWAFPRRAHSWGSYDGEKWAIACKQRLSCMTLASCNVRHFSKPIDKFQPTDDYAQTHKIYSYSWVW